MPNFVLLEGDLANFLPQFGAATVEGSPAELKASGVDKLNGRKICVEGDEKKVQVPGCRYVTDTHLTPGKGTLKIKSLAKDQKAQHINVAGRKPLLLKGSQFDAVFEVTKAAERPNPPGPPVSDITTSYSGKGVFSITDITFIAS